LLVSVVLISGHVCTATFPYAKHLTDKPSGITEVQAKYLLAVYAEMQ
jgi:hypothetical protein